MGDIIAIANEDNDWIKLKEIAMNKAYKETIDFMKEPTIDEEDEEYNSSSSSDVPMSDDEYDYNERKKQKRNHQKWEYNQDEINSFLVCLTKNYAFDFGFHAFGLNADDEKHCWCPLSKAMKGWRGICHLNFEHCTSKGRMFPSALMAHLKT